MPPPLARRVRNRVRHVWTLLRPVSRPKVVGIGLPKTGTTTLGACLRRLGYKHRSHDMALAARTLRHGPAEALALAARHEAFEDWPWFRLWREFDERYPGTRFILTLRRDPETYVASVRRHHEREGLRRPDFAKPAWWDDVFGFAPSAWDYDRSARDYVAHEQAVRTYFAGRRDLLVVCWELGDAWPELASFLGHPPPQEPFPHLR